MMCMLFFHLFTCNNWHNSNLSAFLIYSSETCFKGQMAGEKTTTSFQIPTEFKTIGKLDSYIQWFWCFRNTRTSFPVFILVLTGLNTFVYTNMTPFILFCQCFFCFYFGGVPQYFLAVCHFDHQCFVRYLQLQLYWTQLCVLTQK